MSAGPSGVREAVGRIKQDIAKAKKLLADAGYPNGIDAEIVCRPQPAWELLAVQAHGGAVEGGRHPRQDQHDALDPVLGVWTKVPFGFTTWAHRPLGTMVLGLAYRTGAPWNEANWSNKEFDKLLTRGGRQARRRQAPRASWPSWRSIMLEDGPIVLPLWRAVFNYMDKKIKGYKIHPSSYIEAKEMWIDA